MKLVQYLKTLQKFDFSQFNGLQLQTIGEVRLVYQSFTFSGELFNGRFINKFALKLDDTEFTGTAEDTQIVGEYKGPQISISGVFAPDTFELSAGRVVTEEF